MPGVDPLPSEQDDDDDDASDEVDLPLVSQVQQVDALGKPLSPNDRGDDIAIEIPAGTQPGRKARTIQQEPENDPEASFVKAVRQSKQDKSAIGDVTAVKELPRKPPKRGAHLFVLEGPDQGGETDVEVNPSLLGRSATAEIGLTDPCISVRHAELTLTDDGWVIMDLGSTSGTLVNGVLIEGETKLEHGDVIAIGKTEIRFTRAAKMPAARPEPVVVPPPIEPTEQLPPRERTSLTKPATVVAPPPRPRVDPAVVRAKVRKTTTTIIAACVAVLVVLVVGRVVYTTSIDDKAPAQIRAQVAALLADGRARLLAQDVEGAKNSALTVLSLDDKNEEAQSLLKMAETEEEAKDAIALALRLGDEERDIEAGQILMRIPDASVFAPTRDRLRRTLDERGMVRSRRAIEGMLDEGRWKDALAAADKHVASWPHDDLGAALRERALAAHDAQPKNPALSLARAAFAAGDVDKARGIAADNGLKGYVRDLDEFQAAVQQGKASLKRFDDAAADALDKAFRLLGALGGNAGSPIFAEVRKPYADALYLQGAGLLDENPCAGARALFKASRVVNDDPKIQQKLRELDEKANAGLERARAARAQDPERASAIAREHLCLAHSGTKTYEDLRALSRL